MKIPTVSSVCPLSVWLLWARGWLEARADAGAAAALEAAGLLGGELPGLGAGQPHAAGAHWDHWARERQHHH